ncbi:MAG: class I SAM-dependent rRNA methyltransferase [Myxococcota bacterium]|nr:class I SAM-dependent rRNA methyltransferase [Myxococcota bacterium]
MSRARHDPGQPPSLRLKRALRAAIEAGHPWIWRDALEPFDLAPGTVVRVHDDRGPVATGLAEQGPIGVRVLAARSVAIDDAFFASRVARAASLRDRVIPGATDAYRLVHGEGDGLPGTIVDVYDRWAVIQFDGAAAERWRGAILAGVLRVRPALAGVLVRTGRRETKRVELVHGEAPPPQIDVREHGMVLRADLMHGQKTGLFLDHRESRARVRALSRGLRVLNLYGYTGAFSIAAGLGGATEVDTVDVAAPALRLAEESWSANQLTVPHRTHARDAPELLDEARARGRRWDLVIADPPSFAPNEASVPQAIKSYRALHRACLRVLEPNGLYLAASCSSHIDRATFDRTLREAAEKVGPLQVLERSGAPADHPRLAAFPEGDYLKVVLARRLD